MFRVLARLAADDRGQDLIEYGLLAALISVIAVAVITSVGTKLQSSYTAIDAVIP
jgi:pilus assembly protein Flp/PilA